MTSSQKGAYGPQHDIVDYILGITYEIWEQRGVDLIHQYYSEDCVIWGLDGITRGATAVVDATNATLEAFPDRRLLGENVIWSGSREDGYYTSHRLLSLATNRGDSVFGPATGKPIRMTNIADCVIEDGVITREWLVRDNGVLAEQLGADAGEAAVVMADRLRGPAGLEYRAWLEDETRRLAAVVPPEPAAGDPADDPQSFAWRVLSACWRGDRPVFDRCYAPYVYLHRSPQQQYSGRDAVFRYYSGLREMLGEPDFSVDHVAGQPFSTNGMDIAVRWTAAGKHVGRYRDMTPSGKPVFILGATHWRCIDGRIVSEVTVFDELAVLSQLL